MKLWYINFFLLLAGPCVALEAEVSAQAYIDTSLAVWEARYEHCKSQERSRPLPDQSILDRLRDYEDEQVRTYLVSRSQQAIEECTRQEAGDLSYTLLAITNSSETTPAERKETLEYQVSRTDGCNRLSIRLSIHCSKKNSQKVAMVLDQEDAVKMQWSKRWNI